MGTFGDGIRAAEALLKGDVYGFPLWGLGLVALAVLIAAVALPRRRRRGDRSEAKARVAHASPDEGEEQFCPICRTQVRYDPRYPKYVCKTCYKKAASADGRPLAFYNTSAGGGYRAEYADTGEPYESHDCFIEVVACRANEHKFGGIVIEVVDEPRRHG